ncbi:MAG: class I SAM-dependent methyltransferase, partial [Synechococcus sp.]
VGADGVVMAYGLRNLSDPAAGLKEIHRLLRPGGRAGVLDFNRPPVDSPAAVFQRFYLRRLVVPAAAAVGLREEYAYLEQSLKRFPDGAAQEMLALEAGFQTARHRQLVAGQMGLLLLGR